MKAKTLLILILILLIAPGCSHDESAPPASTPDPAPNPPNTTNQTEITHPNPPETQTSTPTIPPTDITPPPTDANQTSTDLTTPPTDANQPPATNISGIPDFSKHPYNPQEDISGAVNIFSFTLVSFDREKYLSVLHGDELMIKVATATFDYLAAFKNFENAYISTFGPGAWNNFSPDPSTIDIDTLKRNLAIMEIQQINDRAICIMPGSDQPPVHTIRIDGLWYINLDLMIPYNPTQAKQFVKHQNEIILLLQSMQPLIGNPDYPIEKFNAEYEKRLNDLIKSP